LTDDALRGDGRKDVHSFTAVTTEEVEAMTTTATTKEKPTRKQRCTIIFRPGRPTDLINVRSSFPFLGFDNEKDNDNDANARSKRKASASANAIANANALPGIDLAQDFFRTMTMKPDHQAARRALLVEQERAVQLARASAHRETMSAEAAIIAAAAPAPAPAPAPALQRTEERKEKDRKEKDRKEKEGKEWSGAKQDDESMCVVEEALSVHAESAAKEAADAAESVVRERYRYILDTAAAEASDETKLGAWSTPQVMVADADTERCMVRFLASSMFGIRYEQKMMYLVGGTADGKSVTEKVMTGLLSPLAQPMNSDVLIECRGHRSAGSHESHIADLQGKRLMFLSEIKQSDKINAAMMRRMTGGDPTKTRASYGTYFIIKLYPRAVAHSNYEPHFADGENGDASWRRMLVIWCSMRFPDASEWSMNKATFDWLSNIDPVSGVARGHVRPADEAKADTLLDHGPSVLAYMLRHAHAYFEERSLGLPSAAATQALGKCQRDASGLREFLDECTVWGDGVSPEQRETLDDLYVTYCAWCQAQRNHFVMQKRRFSHSLKSTNKLPEKRLSSGMAFTRIKITKPACPAPTYYFPQ
jgi:hypothetical protein